MTCSSALLKRVSRNFSALLTWCFCFSRLFFFHRWSSSVRRPKSVLSSPRTADKHTRQCECLMQAASRSHKAGVCPHSMQQTCNTFVAFVVSVLECAKLCTVQGRSTTPSFFHNPAKSFPVSQRCHLNQGLTWEVILGVLGLETPVKSTRPSLRLAPSRGI